MTAAYVVGALLPRRRAQTVDGGRIRAISLVVLGSRAGGEITVALALMATQGADALHVAQHQRLGANQIGFIDAECPKHFRQLIGSMR